MNTVETITIHTNEHFEKVFVNRPDMELHILQEASSHVKIHVLDLYAIMTEPAPQIHATHKIYIEQNGPGCTTEVYGLSTLSRNQQVSLETHVKHNVGGGKSNQLVKFVLNDNSQGFFVGDLKIAQDAQQTDAHQTNRNLLLSEHAQMRTMPQLEIYADDVQATHGASTGQLDETAIFYMQQRGIDKQKARQLLVGAFMKDVILTIGDNTTRETLLAHIDEN